MEQIKIVDIGIFISGDNLLQFYLESSEQDKFLILYVFIKLGLLQVKLLIYITYHIVYIWANYATVNSIYFLGERSDLCE